MRIVVKVGTSTLAHPTGHLNIRHMESLCKVLADIKNAGHAVILVSSGAVGMGMGKLSLRERPKTLVGKQAAAAVGQCELMYTYDKLFSEYNHVIAQILLTGGDVRDEERRENFIGTMEHLLEMGVLPVINENDTASTEELGIGELTLVDIIKELEKPGRDPREEMPKPILRTDVLEMKDLSEGMILKGTVRNVIDFGVFVDIGVHQDGLVHISQITNKKFIKHPLEAVSVGDIVDVKVMSVDVAKKRIQLTMIM